MSEQRRRNDGATTSGGASAAEFGTDRRLIVGLAALAALPLLAGGLSYLASGTTGESTPSASATRSTAGAADVQPETDPRAAEVRREVAEFRERLATNIGDVQRAIEQPTTTRQFVELNRSEVPTPPTVEPIEVAEAVEAVEEPADTDEPATSPESPPDFVSFTDVDLMAGLEKQAVTLDFNAFDRTTSAKAAKRTAPATKRREVSSEDPRLAMLDHVEDLHGLPLLGENECKKDEKEALHTAKISASFSQLRQLEDRRSRMRSASTSSHSYSMYDFHTSQILERLPSSEKYEGIDTYVQILQIEEPRIREALVHALGRIDGPMASLAIADRAIFDTSHEVREAALHALRHRPAKEIRDRLVDGLRHPWMPASVNAARTIVAIGGEDIEEVVAPLLDQPDPLAPVEHDDDRVTRRELVRVNHMRNCVLCHAVSKSEKDLVRAVVPIPGTPLPRIYYGSRNRESILVRADVTYIRQDFSVLHDVEGDKFWPKRQRFDYFVRENELDDLEKDALKKKAAIGPQPPSPQYRAIQLAAHGLRYPELAEDVDRRLRQLLVRTEPKE